MSWRATPWKSSNLHFHADKWVFNVHFLSYPGFGFNAQVHQYGEQGNGGDGSPPCKQIHVRVSIGLREEQETGWKKKKKKSVEVNNMGMSRKQTRPKLYSQSKEWRSRPDFGKRHRSCSSRTCMACIPARKQQTQNGELNFRKMGLSFFFFACFRIWCFFLKFARCSMLQDACQKVIWTFRKVSKYSKSHRAQAVI